MKVAKAFSILKLFKSYPTDKQLKKQYRLLATMYHPDKFTCTSKKKVANQKFIELNKAYLYLLSLSFDERIFIGKPYHYIPNLDVDYRHDEETKYTYKDNNSLVNLQNIRYIIFRFLALITFPGNTLIIGLFVLYSIVSSDIKETNGNLFKTIKSNFFTYVYFTILILAYAYYLKPIFDSMMQSSAFRLIVKIQVGITFLCFIVVWVLVNFKNNKERSINLN